MALKYIYIYIIRNYICDKQLRILTLGFGIITNSMKIIQYFEIKPYIFLNRLQTNNLSQNFTIKFRLLDKHSLNCSTKNKNLYTSKKSAVLSNKRHCKLIYFWTFPHTEHIADLVCLFIHFSKFFLVLRLPNWICRLFRRLEYT